MNESEKYNNALVFATEKHSGQVRIGGLPYISHPIAVAEIVTEKGGDIDARVTALFHDLLEDTDASADEIKTLGGENVLSAVEALTKKEGYVMKDYVKGIRGNKTAFLVKGADRLNNLRSAIVTNDEFKKRYVSETLEWYLDFLPEIPLATLNLAKSVEDESLKSRLVNKVLTATAIKD